MPDESVAIPVRAGRSRLTTRGAAVNVREAAAGDLDELVRMRIALRREEGATRVRTAGRTVRQQTRRDLADPAGVFLVAQGNEDLQGMLRCQAHGPEGTIAVVSAVYVVPSRRRAGVLRALMAAADAWCRTRGLADMRLRCATRNTAGQAAWTSLGFAPEAVILHRAVPGPA